MFVYLCVVEKGEARTGPSICVEVRGEFQASPSTVLHLIFPNNVFEAPNLIDFSRLA